MKTLFIVQQIRDILCGRGKNCLNPPELISSVVYLHIILVKLHEKDKAKEKESDTVLQMKPEHVLTKRFKQSTKWTAKVTSISDK